MAGAFRPKGESARALSRTSSRVSVSSATSDWLFIRVIKANEIRQTGNKTKHRPNVQYFIYNDNTSKPQVFNDYGLVTCIAGR